MNTRFVEFCFSEGVFRLQRLMKIWLGMLIVFILFGIVKVYGAGPDKSTIDQLIQQTKKDIFDKKRKEKSVLGNLTKQQQDLSQLEQNFGQIKDQLNLAQNRLSFTRQELKQLQNHLNVLEHDQQKRQQLLNQRLVTIYKHGFQSYLEILMQADNYGEFINRFDTLSFFIKDDLRLVERLQENKLVVKTKHVAVETKRQQVEHQYKKMTILREQVSQEQQKVLIKVGQTKKELTKIQADRAKLEKALDEYEQTSREIEANIRNHEQKLPDRILGTGILIWPVRGALSSGFGWRYHPVLGTKKFHNGQDIAVPSGTLVHAADNGVVLVSGWEGGYGNFVAIDHGQGISTCYGHNSRLLVSVGDKIVKGQTIAISGSTGLSTGPHVHFEVRRNGVPVNPLQYLP